MVKKSKSFFCWLLFFCVFLWTGLQAGDERIGFNPFVAMFAMPFRGIFYGSDLVVTGVTGDTVIIKDSVLNKYGYCHKIPVSIDETLFSIKGIKEKNVWILQNDSCGNKGQLDIFPAQCIPHRKLLFFLKPIFIDNDSLLEKKYSNYYEMSSGEAGLFDIKCQMDSCFILTSRHRYHLTKREQLPSTMLGRVDTTIQISDIDKMIIKWKSDKKLVESHRKFNALQKILKSSRYTDEEKKKANHEYHMFIEAERKAHKVR